MPLSDRQILALHDERGRVRCPGCGRYRKPADFPEQPAHAQAPGMIIELAPVCGACWRVR